MDPERPERGRILVSDAKHLFADTRRNITQLVSEAELESLPTAGSRHNAFLALVTVAAYHALLDFGIPAGHARDLVSDAGWHLYSAGAKPYVAIARAQTRDPQERLRLALRLLMRFPFSAPGRPAYEVSVREDPDTIHTTWTCCPPLEVVRDHVRRNGERGELELFRASWCSYDWAFNDLLAGRRGGRYVRPHTMSEGDPMCDMQWSAQVAVAVNRQTRSRTSGRGGRS